MSDSAICERCGAAVGPDAAQGLCPACLLEQGLRESQVDTIASAAAANEGTELGELARLFPQLEVLHLLGRGGMGVVYKARQRGLDRLVALKVLPPGVDRNPGFQERFIREARALARLNHPNIVAVYDFGQVDGRYYFLMEFVDGANLRGMLQAGHLTPQQALAIVPQLCDALQFAHEEGIVHRDIKPENILLDRKGRVKIADFGLAKLLSGAVPQDPYTLTAPRQVLGTPHYMAPEQFERPGTVDHRADIYSMGVVFYEMLTGELPLGRFPPPSRKVQVDVRLDEVVLRTLEKEPEHRYQRAGEVKTQLATMSMPASPVTRPPTWNAGNAGPMPAAPVARSPRVSPYAIAGLFCGLLFPAALLLGYLASPDTVGGPFADSPRMIRGIIAVLAVLSIVLSFAFGVEGLRQIRASGGRLYGLKLALADALAYPLGIYDLMIVALVTYLLDPHPGEPSERLMLLGWIIAIVADVFIVRWAWRRATRPVAPSAASPVPAPLPAPYRHGEYALPPRRHVGCFVSLGLAVAGLAVAVVLAFLFPILQYQSARQAQLDNGLGTVSQVQSDSGNGQIPHTYSFQVQSPPGVTTTVWAEVWRLGKLDAATALGIPKTIIPPAGQPFRGVILFQFGPPSPDGRIKAGWQISGNVGSFVSDDSIADPFAGLPLRESTLGDTRSLPPGRRMQVLALRAGKGRLPGSADDERSIGKADGEVRLFVRFDPLTPDDAAHHAAFGEVVAATANEAAAIRPSTRPDSADEHRHE